MAAELFDDIAVSRLWEQLRDGRITCTERNRWALQWARRHPETAEGLVELGTHPSEETARRFLRRAFTKGKLKLAGALQGETGRGKNVYCGFRPRALEHDYELTKWCRCYPNWEYERGNQLARHADAVARSGTVKAFVELDTGSMPLERVLHQRWSSYRNADGYLIVVTTTEKRCHELMAASQMIRQIGLFCRLEEVRCDPWGAVYRNADGVRIAIGEVM